MGDAAAMGVVQRLRDLRSIAEDLAQGEWSARNPIGQRLTLDVLHDQVLRAVLIADVVQRADVRMREWEIARASRSKRARRSLLVVSPDRRP